jgi:hypothetical protein
VGRRAIATLLLVGAWVLPWTTLLPLHGLLAVSAQVLTLVAACHGAGQLVARVSRLPALPAMLAIQVGIAAFVAICGLAIALHVDVYAFQVVLIVACAGLHCVWLVLDREVYVVALEQRLARGRIWLVPVALLLAIAFIHILGAAGDVSARPFDDDGNVLAQIQRLRDTGTLGDLVGYARRAQLGGQVALTALATVPGDVHLARLLEALSCVLALALALSQLRIGERLGALWGMLLLVGAAALPLVSADPTTCWTAVGAILALHALLQLDRSRYVIPIALVAGALVTLRTELAPIGLVGAVATWWPERTSRRRTALVAGVILAVVGPYVITKQLASSRGLASLGDDRLPFLIALAVFAGAVLVCAPMILWARRNERLRWYGASAALVIAGIASELTGDRPYALRFLWPVAIAAGILVIFEVARAKTLTVASMLVALALALLVHEGRTASGRRRWPRRYLDLVANIEYLAHAAAADNTDYNEILRRVPLDATIGIWVTRPERLNYAEGRRIVDLRTPRARRANLQQLARAAGIRFILLERANELSLIFVERR